MKPYQFSLLRYVHNVATEEFVNIGVVMWVPAEKQFLYRLTERYGRLSNFFNGFNSAGYRQMLRELKHRLREAGKKETSHVETISDLLPRIVLIESGCFQWSAAMGGIAVDPAQRLNQLFVEMIERHEDQQTSIRRDEAAVMKDVAARFRQHGIATKLNENVEVKGGKYSYKFKYGWQNGKRQMMEPISFDYEDKERVIEKANRWAGRLYNLRQPEDDFQMTGIVAPPQDPQLAEAFKQALEMLADAPKVRKLIREDQIESFIPEIERDLAEAA